MVHTFVFGENFQTQFSPANQSSLLNDCSLESPPNLSIECTITPCPINITFNELIYAQNVVLDHRHRMKNYS